MNLLSHKTWHEKLASLLKHQLLPERVVIKNWHTYQCWQHTGFTNALFWAAVIKVILPFKRDGMLIWRASMLGLAAAAKEEKKGTSWLIKLTYQVSAGARWKITCLGNAASRLAVIIRQCQCRESCQDRCKHPESCACSQQERIRQGADTNRPVPPTGTQKRCTNSQSDLTDKLFCFVGCNMFPLFYQITGRQKVRSYF